jgi:carbamoyl-phosphate synthase large subunit
MGTADTFGKAYQKAQMSVGKPIPLSGTAIVDMPVAGYEDFFDVKEMGDFDGEEAIKEALHDGDIDLVLSRNRDVLEVCVEETITYFSTIESAQAALEAIRAQDEPLDVESVDDRPKMQEYWGQPKEREDLRSQIATLREIAEEGYLEALAGADSSDVVTALDTVLGTIDDSVLLLGTAEEGELDDVKGHLDKLGYNANVAASLPGEGEEATATYMMLSKFSILVDRDPSTRLTEVETAKAHNDVLARLVPADVERQETHLLGGHDVDADHIESFEFEDSPAEVLDDAIEWAESVVEGRTRSR